MSELVIETRGLLKEFRSLRKGNKVAVRDLDLRVPAGGVHGFLDIPWKVNLRQRVALNVAG